jgi:hypothetical protein
VAWAAGLQSEARNGHPRFKYRIILEVVLGVGDDRWKTREWRNQVAKVRRAEARRRFRDPEGAVTFGTIRQHHEPRAIKALAAIIVNDETETRTETTGEQSIMHQQS